MPPGKKKQAKYLGRKFLCKLKKLEGGKTVPSNVKSKKVDPASMEESTVEKFKDVYRGRAKNFSKNWIRTVRSESESPTASKLKAKSSERYGTRSSCKNKGKIMCNFFTLRSKENSLQLEEQKVKMALIFKLYI